jgi:hypothetical protein
VTLNIATTGARVRMAVQDRGPVRCEVDIEAGSDAALDREATSVSAGTRAAMVT